MSDNNTPMTDRERTDWFREKLGRSVGPEHPANVRDREHQDALKARATLHQQWRDYISATPLSVNELGSFQALREACQLTVGDIAEIAAVSPNDVLAVEANPQAESYADMALKIVASGLVRRLEQAEAEGGAS